MAGFGSYFKGEKKKKKKGEQPVKFSSAPVFTPPQIVGKKKQPWE